MEERAMSPSEAKDAAHKFLRTFHEKLKGQLRPAAEMEPFIRETVKHAKPLHAERHLRLPESAFLNTFVIPALADAIRACAGLTLQQAREALLNEYHPSMSDLSCGSPARRIKHPFTKVLSLGSAPIYSRWVDPQNGSPLVQSCPDFALRSPFPHKVVFEGKYFSNGSQLYAQRELVTNIYQAFFYRGLPFVEGTAKRAAWDYDYSCLLAYDASPKGTLAAAWSALPSKVQESFWEGANIYVMILGGEGRPAN
jgi:hypothetical protein